MTVLAAVQARMSSSRLPGKVLAPVMGRPMLALQIERIRRARGIDALVVATSTGGDDDAIDALCESEGCACHRGPLEDVLARFAGAARAHGADHIVRLTGDCPLTDPQIVDAAVVRHLEGAFDYTSNCFPRTYPDGLDVEVMTRAALDAADAEAGDAFEREHVTPFISRRPERFRRGNIARDEDRSSLRVTVDTQADLEVVRAIFTALCPDDPGFGDDAIIALLDARPDLVARNARPAAPAASSAHG